ncbi:hypothetical protein Tco_1181587 [Tanacetum coccineum]
MIDAPQTNVQATQFIEDTHVIITAVNLEVHQQSSSSTSLVDVPVNTNVEIPPSSAITLPPPHILLIQYLQQTPVSTTTIVLSTSLQNLPTFGSLFKFEDRVKSLENNFSEFKQTNLFAEAVSSIPDIVDKYIANQMNEAVKAVV